MITVALAAAAFQSQNIDSYIQKGFRDITFNASITQRKLSELKKIGPEFAQTYLFDSITVRAKEPFRLRLDAAADDTKASYVINGARQQFKIPRLGINKSDDLTKYPGRRQTLLDFAMPTESLFDKFYEAKFVRFDRETGNPVFDLRFPAAWDDTSRNRIWIDKSKHFIVKREWYGQKDQLRAIFTYEAPAQFSGIWFPTKLTVRNSENVVAGSTKYANIKVNTGLDESIFKL